MLPARRFASPALLAALFACAASPRPARAQEPAPAQPPPAAGLALGAAAPDDLAFTCTRYLPRRLADLCGAKATALVFVTSECPLARRYLGRLDELERALRARGVAFAIVAVGPQDDPLRVADLQVGAGLACPAVVDPGAAAARALGVGRTPEVVVLDGARRLRYRGRIDDQHRLGGSRPAPTREDLREALEDVLAGREVRVPTTPVDGCLIAPPAPPPATTPTWAEHVAPLVRRSCVPCHRPGAEGPFFLVDYDDATAHAPTIAEVVEQGRMPPWFASPEHGRFTNARALTTEERATIVAWARGGAPRGDPAKEPPPLPDEPVGRWRIGEPDLVVAAPSHFEVPKEGWVDYQYIVLPLTIAEDLWVEAIEILPENPRVVHHANLAAVSLGPDGNRVQQFLTGRVPGGGPLLLEPGVAARIPAGSVLVVQAHYVTTGRPERDRIAVGLRWARGPVRKQMHVLIVDQGRLEIPPGEAAHRVVARKRLPADAVGMGLFSHMHLRGRDMTFRARRPDGAVETLLRIPNYSFDWQLGYVWPEGAMRLPKGTTIEVEGHFDNSRWNPYNPDPARTIRWGEQSEDEMFMGFLYWVDADERLDLRVDPATGRARPAPRGRQF